MRLSRELKARLNFDSLLDPGTLRRTETILMRGLLLLIALLSGPRVPAAELLVFAAASLSDVLQEIAKEYQKSAGDKVVYSFASSSLLARQIAEGARADLFLSADEEKMDALEKQGLIKSSTRRSLLSNTLVVVVAKESPLAMHSPADLKQVERVAVAEPNTVPAGIYARRYFEKIVMWKNLQVIPTENVRGALAAVESGNAGAGIVYKTDAAISAKVRIAWEAPPSDDLRISYAAAVLNEGRQPAAAEAFLKYLLGPESTRAFERFGFIVFREKQRPNLEH